MQNDPLVEILKKNFEKRKLKNSHYSLHAFSRDLDLDVSNLSKILKYQKKIGQKLRSRIGLKLGFEISEVESLLKPSLSSKTHDTEYAQHDLKIFEMVSEWQHYAILEYLKLADEAHTPQSIAKRLGLTLQVAEDSVNRLIGMGLVVKVGKKLKSREESSSSILSKATSKAHREQQKQILEGAIEALDKTPIEHRSQSSITMAIDTNRLEEAKELIKNFRRDLGKFLSSSKNLNEVYQLSVSLYPVTKNKTNQGVEQ